MKRIFSGILILTASMMLSSMSLRTDPIEGGAVKWMTFEEAVEKSKTEKRKIFIDVYTNWCGWCKVMDKNTFSDPEVARLLNENFYPVKFNAEQTEDVVFRGVTYKLIQSGNSRTHQLAAALLNNQLSYPTVVLVEEDFKSVSPVAGYRKADEIHKMLTYFAFDHFKKGPNALQEFEKVYKSPYISATKTDSK